jgi:hypothetical protein
MTVVPSPEEIAFMLEDIDNTRVPDIYISTGVCGAFTLLAIALRFTARLCSTGIGKDDYTAILAFVSCCRRGSYFVR